MLLSQTTSTINTVKFDLIKFVIDFEMEDIVTSAHWYWKVEYNFLQSLSDILLLFLVTTNQQIAFKSLFDLHFHSFVVEFF